MKDQTVRYLTAQRVRHAHNPFNHVGIVHATHCPANDTTRTSVASTTSLHGCADR